MFSAYGHQVHICFCFCCTVKSEIKLEDRINSMDIQEEANDRSLPRLKYPESMDEFLDRTEPQLFLMQVRLNHSLRQYSILLNQNLIKINNL